MLATLANPASVFNWPSHGGWLTVEKPCGLRRHLPLAGRQVAPRVDLRANFIDDRCEVVRLFLRRKAFAFVEVQLLLTAPAPLFRLRDRCDELGPPPSVDQVSGGLTRFVELPMLTRILVRRVDDRPVEERVRHSLVFLPPAQPASEF